MVSRSYVNTLKLCYDMSKFEVAMGINVRLHRRKIYLKMTMQIVLLNVYETR